MNTQHTQGPWRTEGACIHAGNGHRIAEVKRAHDMSLIAAAPELLAALRQIVSLQARDYETPEDMLMAQVEIARAAIAKAEGK